MFKSKDKAKKQEGSGVQPVEVTPELLEQMTDNASEAAFKKVNFLTFGVLILTAICVFALIWVASKPAQPPKIYTVDKNGQLTLINAFNQPPASASVLTQIATRSVIELLDFNSLNYERVIEQENRALFLADKYHQAYVDSVYQSPWFEPLAEGYRSMKAIPTGLPVIENPKGSYSESLGMQHWLVSVPVSIYIESAGAQPTELKRIFTIQLVHAKQYEYKAGIAIANMKVEPAR